MSVAYHFESNCIWASHSWRLSATPPLTPRMGQPPSRQRHGWQDRNIYIAHKEILKYFIPPLMEWKYRAGNHNSPDDLFSMKISTSTISWTKSRVNKFFFNLLWFQRGHHGKRQFTCYSLTWASPTTQIGFRNRCYLFLGSTPKKLLD